ncbi:MAG: alpha/beta hydrolase [Acidobacteria bacterium]|nr:alpha/beta hydrolase [Acidobacteriota bacterium]
MGWTGKKMVWIAAGILIAGILIGNPARHLLFSVRLALDLKALAAGSDGPDPAVAEGRVSGRDGDRHYEALCYRPVGGPASTAVVLSAGISELGCYHPRLVALARLLAKRGLMVITPDIREFRQFQITAAPIEQMLFWHSRARSLEGGERVGKTGFAGVSYSGTLALMAAARPAVRDRTAFVAAVGPYYDLKRCSRGWFAAGSEGEWQGYYPTRYYARWVMMLSALDMVADDSDRRWLRRRLQGLLEQKDPPDSAPLTPEGERWHALATMRPGRTDAPLAAEIEEFLSRREYTDLDPRESLDALRCPVFLIHGAYDDLIPPAESADLHRAVASSRLLVSPFLTHTHPVGTELSRPRQVRAAVEAILFSCRFSGALD